MIRNICTLTTLLRHVCLALAGVLAFAALSATIVDAPRTADAVLAVRLGWWAIVLPLAWVFADWIKWTVQLARTIDRCL